MANGFNEELDVEKLHENGCEFGRHLDNRVRSNEEDINSMGEIINELQDRPSWIVTGALVFLTNLVTALTILQLGG